VHRWLWAYPRRWRWTRADDVVGTLADRAAPGATRLDVRSGLGLVVHGLATRRRMRPPLRVRLRYLGGGGAPWQYRGWVADEIASSVFGWRLWVYFVVFLSAISSGAFGLLPGASPISVPPYAAFWLLIAVVGFVRPRTREQRRAASQHLVPQPGDEPTPWDLRRAWVLRDRVAARVIASHACAATAVAAVAAGVAVGLTGAGPLRVPAACLGLGAVAAVRLAVRWRMRGPHRPAQPARRTVAAAGRALVTTWCFAGAMASLLAFLAPIFPGVAALAAAPLILDVALLVLPALAVAAVLGARGPADVTVIDLWRLLVGHGPLPVDALASGACAALPARPTAGVAAPIRRAPPLWPKPGVPNAGRPGLDDEGGARR